jgi:predicted MFS family arabinose efflux permease
MARLKQIHLNIKNRDPKTVYYLLVFLQYLVMSLTVTTYVLFLFSRGLNPLQANLVNMVFMLGNSLFEIPTGVYADYFGRKKSIMLFFLVWTVSNFIYFFSGSISGFILAELIAALALSFMTGTPAAWLVSAVGEGQFIGRIDFILSQAEVYGKTAFVVGGLLGAYLGRVNLALPFLVESFLSIFALVLVWVLIKEDFTRARAPSFKQGWLEVLGIFKESLTFLRSHPIVKWLVLSTVVFWLAFQPFNMFWSPYFTQLGQVDVSRMGWLWVVFSLAIIFGSWWVKRLTQQQYAYSSIAILTVLFLGLPAVLSGLITQFWPAVVFFSLYEVGRGLEKTFSANYLNLYVPSDKRATLFSFNGLLGRIGAALGLIGFGWVGKAYGFSLSWVIAGLILLLPLFIFLHLKRIKTN